MNDFYATLDLNISSLTPRSVKLLAFFAGARRQRGCILLEQTKDLRGARNQRIDVCTRFARVDARRLSGS